MQKCKVVSLNLAHPVECVSDVPRYVDVLFWLLHAHLLRNQHVFQRCCVVFICILWYNVDC